MKLVVASIALLSTLSTVVAFSDYDSSVDMEQDSFEREERELWEFSNRVEDGYEEDIEDTAMLAFEDERDLLGPYDDEMDGQEIYEPEERELWGDTGVEDGYEVEIEDTADISFEEERDLLGFSDPIDDEMEAKADEPEDEAFDGTPGEDVDVSLGDERELAGIFDPEDENYSGNLRKLKAGKYFYIRHGSSGLVVAASGGKCYNGVPLIQWTKKTGDDSQLFKWDSKGRSFISKMSHTKKCGKKTMVIDLPYGKCKEGTPLQLYEMWGGKPQQFEHYYGMNNLHCHTRFGTLPGKINSRGAAIVNLSQDRKNQASFLGWRLEFA